MCRKPGLSLHTVFVFMVYVAMAIIDTAVFCVFCLQLVALSSTSAIWTNELRYCIFDIHLQGRGGPYCKFYVKDIGMWSFVVLENCLRIPAINHTVAVYCKIDLRMQMNQSLILCQLRQPADI